MGWKFRYYAMRTFAVALMFLGGGVLVTDRTVAAGLGLLSGVILYSATEIVAAIRGQE